MNSFGIQNAEKNRSSRQTHLAVGSSAFLPVWAEKVLTKVQATACFTAFWSDSIKTPRIRLNDLLHLAAFPSYIDGGLFLVLILVGDLPSHHHREEISDTLQMFQSALSK